MRLVGNWRHAWKWFSVQLAIVGAAGQAAVMAFPDIKDWLGDTVTHIFGLAILVGLIAGRLVDQSKTQ